MAHREQHSHREAKKPKKDKGSTRDQTQKWAVSKIVEEKSTSKH